MANAIESYEAGKIELECKVAILEAENAKLKADSQRTEKLLLDNIRKVSELEDIITNFKASSSANFNARSTDSGSSLMGIGAAFREMQAHPGSSSSMPASEHGRTAPPKKKYKKTEVYLYPANRKSDGKQRKPMVSTKNYF